MLYLHPHRLRNAGALLLALASAQVFAADAPQSQSAVGKLKTVKVEAQGENVASEQTESYVVESTPSATGLNLSLRDTPQAVTVITQQTIKDQGMKTVSDALRSATGVSVKAVDRGRNSLSARGFTISNYQLDGVPTVTGNIGIETANTAIYDRVEVIRGSTGLLNGSGDPSATVNLVRKHAVSDSFVGKVDVTLGSWDHRGATIDLSTPLNSDGTVRARFIAHKAEQDSFIDLENTDNQVLYAVLDANFSANTEFTLGASEEQTNRNGVYWGGLPIWYTDGTRTKLKRSSTTAPRWNQWDTKDQTLFTSLKHRFGNDWSIRANANYHRQEEYSNLLWITGEPDKTTGEGMAAYPYLYITEPKQEEFGLTASGPFSLFGREHELMLGVMRHKYEGGWDNGGTPISAIPEVGNFFDWDGSYPVPVWGTPELGSFDTTIQSGAYASTRLQFSDSFKLIAGTRVSNWETTSDPAVWNGGEGYHMSHDDLVTPYLGAIYDLGEQVSAYASYTEIFKAQTARDRTGEYLDPLTGNSYELGLKGEFLEGALNASAAIFLIEQDNVATPDGDIKIPGTSQQAFYGAKGTESKGYELEMVGQLTEAWDISLSWTQFSAKDADDNDVSVEHPRKVLKLFSKYQLSGDWAGLSLGGGIDWQSEEPRRQTNPVTGVDEKIGQPAFTLLDLLAAYEFNDQLSLQLNVYNLLDESYYESSWGTYTYGDPVNARLQLRYTF